MAVDERRDHGAAAEVDVAVGGGAAGPVVADPEHLVVVADDQRGVVDRPLVVVGGGLALVEGAELADARHEGGHRASRRASKASRNSGATGPRRWCSPRSTTSRPSTTTVDTSAAVAV